MGGILFAGVVFDMDGTLFDTEWLSRDAWLEVGAELGWPQPGREHHLFTGLNRAAIAQKLACRYGPAFLYRNFWTPAPAGSRSAWSERAYPSSRGLGGFWSF